MHYRSNFPEIKDKPWKMKVYYRNKNPFSKNYEYKEMILFIESVKEITEPLKDLKSYKERYSIFKLKKYVKK